LDEALDGGGFRHVAPVFLRHVLAHQLRVHAGRIEGALVIVLPSRLEGILVRRVAALRGRAEGQDAAIPLSRADRGQDGPAQRAEALDEKRCRPLQNEVLRLEPGDEVLAAVLLHAAEAQEGVHLMDVAAHAFAHQPEPMHERIAGDVEKAALAVQHAPDEGVEERVTLRVAVRHHVGDELVHGARQG
jgi:hypothetical protein